jgi:hypothetical protein
VAAGKVRRFLSENGHDVIIEQKSISHIREDNLTIKNIVDWLLESHLHFVITHPHQGLYNLGWSATDIYNEIFRLKYHRGFPTLEKLKCPIFCQDKWIYLQHLPSTMPTYKIQLLEEVEVEVVATETGTERRSVCS